MRNTRLIKLASVAAAALATGLAVPAYAQTVPHTLVVPHAGTPPAPMAGMDSRTAGGTKPATADLASSLAAARLATAKYATNLGKAKADGYQIITKAMPGMGFHYMNRKITGFDVRKPQILVYEHSGSQWQLGALEWVFPTMPKTPPLPNATFGFFPAACHYADGTFIPHTNAKTCPQKAPTTGATFTFWHPGLVTMHVWVWYPNPAGMFSSTNPLIAPFNQS
jgi:hypothetical protein